VKIQIRYLLAVPPLLFLGVFYFYPLISIFGLSFAPEGAWETGKLYRLVGNPKYVLELYDATGRL
jgi:thiamine transport system permease protein